MDLLRAPSPDLFDQVDEIDESFLWPFLHLLDTPAKPVAKPIRQAVATLITTPIATPIAVYPMVKPFAAPPAKRVVKKSRSTRLPLHPINANNNSSDVLGGYAAPLSPEPQKPATSSYFNSDFAIVPSLSHQSAEPPICVFGEQCRLCNLQNEDISNTQKRVGRGRRAKALNSEATYLDEYFAHYPSFPYNAAAPVVGEFFEMCDFFGWVEGSKKRRTAHGELKSAMVLQFNSYYGTDENDIASWRNLCQVLNIFPVPGGLEACRKAVLLVHVNIVDLVDTQKTGRPVDMFDSLRELSEYTIATGKFFPLQHALAGGLLKFLLRQIRNPGRSVRGVRRYHI